MYTGGVFETDQSRDGCVRGSTMKLSLRPLSMSRFRVALWVLLSDSLSPGRALFGLALSFVLVGAAAPRRPLRAFPKKPWTSAKLICHVAADIAASNVAVARLIC